MRLKGIFRTTRDGDGVEVELESLVAAAAAAAWFAAINQNVASCDIMRDHL